MATVVETNKDELIKTMSVMTALSLTFLTLRLICKGRYSKAFATDDALLGVAWACLISSNVLSCLATKYGLGYHITDITDFVALITANEYLFIAEALMIWGISFAKTSFCFTLLRLAVQKWHKWVLWFCIVTINIVMWFCALTFFISCNPVAKKWDTTLPGTCWDSDPVVNFAVFAGIYSAMTDVALAIFPCVLIWKLQMKRVEKIGVCLCMSMGIVSGVMACVKSAFLVDSLSDYTYKSVPLLMWSSVELSVVVIACSVPFLRLLFKEIRTKSSSRGRSKYASQGYRLDAINTFNDTKTPKNRTLIKADTTTKITDDSSDKSILGSPQGLSAIRRTDVITIQHSGRDQDDGFHGGFAV
ncbi:hypothetical protein BX600DRAFT_65139 [Xylariales sp. PMI_506]|nr:hypothetical protein BX600DRAFT_65139 [Xylariales sp. PMI_506]